SNLRPSFPTYWGEYNKFISADMDGNGSQDLIASDLGFGRIWIYLNDGSGNFQLPLGYSIGLGSQTAGQTIPVTVGDFNGDGLGDVAIVNWSTATLTVFVNTPAIAVYPSRVDFGTI